MSWRLCKTVPGGTGKERRREMFTIEIKPAYPEATMGDDGEWIEDVITRGEASSYEEAISVAKTLATPYARKSGEVKVEIWEGKVRRDLYYMTFHPMTNTVEVTR